MIHRTVFTRTVVVGLLVASLAACNENDSAPTPTAAAPTTAAAPSNQPATPPTVVRSDISTVTECDADDLRTSASVTKTRKDELAKLLGLRQGAGLRFGIVRCDTDVQLDRQTATAPMYVTVREETPYADNAVCLVDATRPDRPGYATVICPPMEGVDHSGRGGGSR